MSITSIATVAGELLIPVNTYRNRWPVPSKQIPLAETVNGVRAVPPRPLHREILLGCRARLQVVEKLLWKQLSLIQPPGSEQEDSRVILEVCIRYKATCDDKLSVYRPFLLTA